jgi:hypothetical protein
VPVGAGLIVESWIMPKARLAYERSSRTSQALIVGFSLAVVAMTGWLALLIMVSRDANTKTADAFVSSPPPEPPRLENPPSDAEFPLARTVRSVAMTPERPLRVEDPLPDNEVPFARAVRSVAATPLRLPGRDGVVNIPPLPSPPDAAPGAAPPPTATASASRVTSAMAPPSTYTPSPVGTASGNLRIVPTDPPVAAETDVMPVPLPRPRRLASIPLPRPRPQIDEGEAPKDKTLLDLLIELQR